jgi:hypothetical protein
MKKKKTTGLVDDRIDEQDKNGDFHFTAVPHNLLAAITRAKLKETEYKVILFLFREIYGWKQNRARGYTIVQTEWAAAYTGLKDDQVRKVFRALNGIILNIERHGKQGVKRKIAFLPLEHWDLHFAAKELIGSKYDDPLYRLTWMYEEGTADQDRRVGLSRRAGRSKQTPFIDTIKDRAKTGAEPPSQGGGAPQPLEEEGNKESSARPTALVAFGLDSRMMVRCRYSTCGKESALEEFTGTQHKDREGKPRWECPKCGQKVTLHPDGKGGVIAIKAEVEIPF